MYPHRGEIVPEPGRHLRIHGRFKRSPGHVQGSGYRLGNRISRSVRGFSVAAPGRYTGVTFTHARAGVISAAPHNLVTLTLRRLGNVVRVPRRRRGTSACREDRTVAAVLCHKCTGEPPGIRYLYCHTKSLAQAGPITQALTPGLGTTVPLRYFCYACVMDLRRWPAIGSLTQDWKNCGLASVLPRRHHRRRSRVLRDCRPRRNALVTRA